MNLKKNCCVAIDYRAIPFPYNEIKVSGGDELRDLSGDWSADKYTWVCDEMINNNYQNDTEIKHFLIDSKSIRWNEIKK